MRDVLALLRAKREYLKVRAAVVEGIRRFFAGRGYLEVSTPVRIPAPAPEPHIDAVPSHGWFLQTSPEIAMKRLLAAGYGRIFQVCPCFRLDERGSRHLSEFTLLEWYAAGADYRDMMAECEDLVLFVSRRLGRGDRIDFRGQPIDLSGPWERITVDEAFRKYAGRSAEEALRTGKFDEDIAFSVEPQLRKDRPVILYDYPASQASLARLKETDPSVAERFECYIGGMELANAFTELTDPAEQRERFVRDREERKQAGKTDYPLPEPFLEELRYMPPSSGVALGVDRLVMLFTGAASIDDVVPFPPEIL
jgi:lysyl-tRNA synthetase class 2